MKNTKSLLAVLTVMAVSFACAPVTETPVAETPAPATPEVTTEQPAFPWTDDATNCCGQKSSNGPVIKL